MTQPVYQTVQLDLASAEEMASVISGILKSGKRDVGFIPYDDVKAAERFIEHVGNASSLNKYATKLMMKSGGYGNPPVSTVTVYTEDARSISWIIGKIIIDSVK